MNSKNSNRTNQKHSRNGSSLLEIRELKGKNVSDKYNNKKKKETKNEQTCGEWHGKLLFANQRSFVIVSEPPLRQFQVEKMNGRMRDI